MSTQKKYISSQIGPFLKTFMNREVFLVWKIFIDSSYLDLVTSHGLLNQLTKGNGKIVFKWTPTQQQAFEQIKNKLCTTPVIVLLDLHQSFEIETDASDYALTVVIT